MAENARSYRELKAELEVLEHQIEAVRAQELEAVIAEIRAKIAEYGLTEQNVFGRRHGKGGVTRGAKCVSIYRDPATGATWGGRGRRPAWLDVENIERFLVQL